MNTTTRMADGKGRVALGARFANQTVLVEEVDSTEVRVTIARVIPEREMWLHRNPTARDLVRRGVEEAQAGDFSTAPPDLESDAAQFDPTDDD